MAKSNLANKISIASYDSIFSTENERLDKAVEKVVDIPLSEIHTFSNHPFKVFEDESLLEMAESIKEYGVLVPALVRPVDTGGYELIAGHRRKRASELAQKITLPCIIRDLDNDTATIIMVDSNMQRESLLPSEKAWAYRLKLDAVKRQGSRTDLTSRQVVGKLEMADAIGKDFGESGRQVQRYIRLTELISDLLCMVDNKKLAFNPAVELSYLQTAQQAELISIINNMAVIPSFSQAQRLKKYSQEDKLSVDVMEAIMSEEKQESQKITFTGEKLKQYFPQTFTAKQMEETIITLLKNWHRENMPAHK